MIIPNGRKKLVYTAAAFMLLLAAGCSIYPEKLLSYFGASKPAVSAMPYEYRIYPVKKTPCDVTLKTSGKLECINELGISVPDGIWGARIEKLAAEGSIVESGEVICSLNTSAIEENLNRAMTELSNSENELEDFKMQNELEDMSKKTELAKKDLQYEVSLFKLGEIKKGADTIEVAISKIGIEKNRAFIENFQSKLKSQEELLKKGFLSSFQFGELELDYQRNLLELEQNYNKLEMLDELPLAEEVKKNETGVLKLSFDRKLTAKEHETAAKLNTIEEEKKELNINEKKHKVQQAQSMIDKAQVKAPISGTLLYSNSWIGKTRVGMEVWSGLDILKIVDLKNMKIIVKVNEKYIDEFSEGSGAKISLSCDPARTLNGFVKSVSKLAKLKDERDPKGPKEFDVTIYFSETSEIKLLPNMSADVSIVCRAFKNAARVPKDFADGGLVQIVSPVKQTIDLKNIKKLSGAPAGAGKESAPAGGGFIMGAEDENYFYFLNDFDEFGVLIPEKGLDTVETKI
ncbi:MAG: HlyD family secretion protein [bacterium ADurb.Bin243]|nr:MAG: HlyD family secretion protein [bacterium ADurb.Bin243]